MHCEELRERFRALHVPGKPLVMPNPWDIGSAKVMAKLGAKALATTSSGHGFTLGLSDGGQIAREVALQHAADICAAVDVPVNGDFENGFGENPETVAETVRLAAEVGLAGVSIEDTAVPTTDSYPFDLALTRIEAAVAAARSAGVVLTARADGWLLRNYDQAEALRRALLGAVFAKQMGKYSKCFLCVRVFQPDSNRKVPIANFDVDMWANCDVARHTY